MKEVSNIKTAMYTVRITPPRLERVLIFSTLSLINTTPVLKATVQGQLSRNNTSKSMSFMNTNFKPARLCIPSKNAKDQRWYITYWVYDIAISKRKRIKEYEVNTIKSERERKRFAKYRINEINLQLSKNSCINSLEITSQSKLETIRDNHEKLPYNTAIDFFINHQTKKQLRGTTLKEYNRALNLFTNFLNSKGVQNPLVFEIRKSFIDEFLDWLTDVKKFQNRTRNSMMGFLKTFFNYVYKELSPEDAPLNSPMNKIEKLPIEMGRNIAFTDEQIRELVNYMKDNFPRQLFLCQFMYYTLARPNEICQLKIKNIGMGRDNCLYIPGSISKNRKDRHVELTPAFKRILQENGILDANPEYYIFSKEYAPGPTPKIAKKISQRFTEKVLKRLGYSSDYTLYSWKHTGVVKAWKAGMSQAAIQTQMGHTNTASFMTYIKSLSLLENKEFADKMPEMC